MTYSRFLAVFAGVACLAVSAPASADAGPDCTKEPKDKWLSEDAMKEKIKGMGYTFDIFKVEGNCYEIYGKNAEGKGVEVYFNPVTAEIVKQEVE